MRLLQVVSLKEEYAGYFSLSLAYNLKSSRPKENKVQRNFSVLVIPIRGNKMTKYTPFLNLPSLALIAKIYDVL
jgi:hypothetical protein